MSPWLRGAVPLILLPLALAGMGISAYLTAAHWGEQAIVCGGLGQCDYVNTSAYATVGGIPVSFLGALLYAAMAGAALTWSREPADDRRAVLVWGIALAGFGYAAYLTYVELFVLHAICVWCVASAIILTTTLIIASAALFLTPTEETAAAPVRKPRRARGRRPRASSPR
jgi:uncharacterized membrane protein